MLTTKVTKDTKELRDSLVSFVTFVVTIPLDFSRSDGRVVHDLQPLGDGIQRLLNPIQFGLGSVRELFEAVRILQVADQIPGELPSASAEKKKAKTAEQDSQSAQTIGKLCVPVHRYCSGRTPCVQSLKTPLPALAGRTGLSTDYDAAHHLDARTK